MSGLVVTHPLPRRPASRTRLRKLRQKGTLRSKRWRRWELMPECAELWSMMGRELMEHLEIRNLRRSILSLTCLRLSNHRSNLTHLWACPSAKSGTLKSPTNASSRTTSSPKQEPSSSLSSTRRILVCRLLRSWWPTAKAKRMRDQLNSDINSN